ncbi:MAG: ABC transporter ATP-binding protein [Chthonomonadales bacterium]
MPPALEIVHLTKRYKDLVAVRDLTFTLEPGDICGFIGPNGAGKTTTIRMLATLLVPSSGTARILGHDIVGDPEAVRTVIGYMPDFFGVYDDIKVWEYLDFFAAAYRIPKEKRPRAIDDVLALTDLQNKREAYVEALSRGMKQRLCLAKTLIHDPAVLLLDEPASGLDPRARIEIKELLKELRNMGKTILVSSHILPELADFCNKIGIIERGELLLFGAVDEIMRRLAGHQTLDLRILDEAANSQADGHSRVDRAMEILTALPDVGEAHHEGDGVITLNYAGPPNGEWAVLQALVMNEIKVLSFAARSADLEDVFMRVTKGVVS